MSPNDERRLVNIDNAQRLLHSLRYTARTKHTACDRAHSPQLREWAELIVEISIQSDRMLPPFHGRLD